MAAQHFTKIASEKTEQAKDAASKVKDKSTGTGKSAYDSVAANLQSARDKSAKQLEDTRSAADQQWAKLQKVTILKNFNWLQQCSPTEERPSFLGTQLPKLVGAHSLDWRQSRAIQARQHSDQIRSDQMLQR